MTEPVFTPIGWQGAAQHTYTRACDGFHEPGPCPGDSTALTVRLPADVYEKLRRAAFDQRTSMNALVIDALRKQQETS